MKTDFLNTLLKEPDAFSKYVEFLINYRGQKLENCYLNTKKGIYSLLSFLNKGKKKSFILDLITTFESAVCCILLV